MPIEPDSSTALWTTLYRLKTTPRTGWLDRGIPAANSESVADHSFFAMLLAWVVAAEDASLDVTRVLRLALIHDLAEAIAGDIPPYDPEDIPTDDAERRVFFAARRERSPANAARKYQAEAEATAQLDALLPDSIRPQWRELWQEYEAQSTPEAHLVKQIDKLEVFIQSRLYAERFPDAPVDGFADMARQAITHPLLIPIRDAFLAEIEPREER